MFDFLYKVPFYHFLSIYTLSNFSHTYSIKMPHRNRRHNRRHHRHHRHHNRTSRTSSRAHPQWHPPMVDMLVDLRRSRNDFYHSIYGSSRQEFWSDIARRFVYMIFYTFFIKIQIQIFHLCEFRINNHFNTRFSGQQCSQKWRNLVRDYRVSKKWIIL